MQDLGFGGSDILSDDELSQVNNFVDNSIDELYKLAQTKQEAVDWLNSKLGKRLRKYIVAEKQRTMKLSITSKDEEIISKAQFDYAVIQQLEVFIGSILLDGEEALKQLEQGDNHEQDTENR